MKTKTAYYMYYDSSKLEAPEYCIKAEMSDDLRSLEDSYFQFGQELVQLTKTCDNLSVDEIKKRMLTIANEYCGDYLDENDDISCLDEYEGPIEYDIDEDEDEDEDDE